jgi:protein-disulfide isomerase
MSDWRTFLQHGILVGEPTAPIQVVAFLDLECPACRGFHLETFRDVKTQFGDSISTVFIHWPLSNHRFARSGAEALECAAAQSKAVEFLDLAFEKQDSIGLKPWVAYARDAGIADTVTFSTCLQIPKPRIDSGRAIAEREEFFGTPTVLVNGWLFPTTPSSARLSRVITALLNGQQPEE